MDEENKIKQQIEYIPQIEYTQNYETDGYVDISDIVPERYKQPYDNETIPSIKDDIEYIDQALKAIPTKIANAIKEVYDPIKDIYEDILWDKIVDPNPQKPGVEIRPINPEPIKPTPVIPDFTVHPIVILPVTKDDTDIPEPENPDIPDDKKIPPIVILPIDKDDDNSNNNNGNVPPIIIKPIPDIDFDDNDDSNNNDMDDDDPGMWDPPNFEIVVDDTDIADAVDRDYVFILSKLVKNYTSTLKDLLNNYFYTVIRLNIGHTKKEKEFILNPLNVSSKDIYNKCKHLLDISIKNENMANLKLSFLENSFNISNTLRHTKAFTVSYELRKRYTSIQYSNGKSKTNAASDNLLKSVNAKYEIQFRTTFENLFRYLNSSLTITDDIFKTIMQDTLSKQTLIKKGGKK